VCCVIREFWGELVSRVSDVHARLVICYVVVSLIAFVAQIRSGSIAKGTADIVMGDILCIWYRVDHHGWKYRYRSHGSKVNNFMFHRRDILSFFVCVIQLLRCLLLGSLHLFYRNPK
jgi:hypothetical protein